MNIETEQYYFIYDDGEKIPREEKMLAKLLEDDVLFCNTRKYLDWDDKTPCSDTIVLFVNCNDVFAWGCADAESITTAELPKLFDLYIANEKCGSMQWVCLKRNEKPQAPIIKYLKDNNGWNDELEKLPENYYDKMCKERYELQLKLNSRFLGKNLNDYKSEHINSIISELGLDTSIVIKPDEVEPLNYNSKRLNFRISNEGVITKVYVG